MSVTLFQDTTYNLTNLLDNIKRGAIALPDIQRPFVWPASKVRDLFDSMYKGFPVGYLLFWFTGAEMGARQIGTDAKETAPRLLIVDGQQRLTSLFAVLTGTPVVTKNYTEGRIRIAFRPEDAALRSPTPRSSAIPSSSPTSPTCGAPTRRRPDATWPG